jgi:hypothetical protein
VSVGLPHARNQRDILVQAWGSNMTDDGIPQVYVSPLVSDAPKALALLYTACQRLMPGANTPDVDTMARALGEIAAVLGAYPQSALHLPAYKKQDTRMLKIWCAKCGYTCRATAKWLAHGVPSCYCGAGPMQTEYQPS